MHLSRITIGVWLALVTAVASQGDELADNIPTCASQCMDSSAASSGCDLGDLECMCLAKDDSSQLSLRTCVEKYCDKTDGNRESSVVIRVLS